MAAKFSNQITCFKPVNGKPRQEFADGSWKNPKTEGPLGKIRWNGWSRTSVAAHTGVSHHGQHGYAVTPLDSGTTVSALSCKMLGERFANAIVAGRQGTIYSRLGTKSGFELECALTGLHTGGCGDTLVFGSGMAAVSHPIFALVAAGDNVVVHKNIYGCSDNFFSILLPALGIEAKFVDMRNPAVLRKAVNARTRAVFFETPSNPALDLIDISAVSDVLKNRCPIIVDNTFASPMGQNPFEQGAHLVMYSLTKSIGGHTNAIGGAVLGSGEFLAHLFAVRKDVGGIMPAREASAFLEGIKTLSLRYSAMEQNAQAVVEMLLKEGKVAQVFYPSLDPLYPKLEGRQMKGPGYMIAFELKSGMEGGMALIDSLDMITNTVSLGSVETLICHPASTTHACVPKEQREAKGITDGLIRISIGTEFLGDILGDLRQAFSKVSGA